MPLCVIYSSVTLFIFESGESTSMHKYETTIRLHHTDAAGVLYFANLFVLAHECYESFMEGCISLSQIIAGNETAIPIIHTEADYLKPIMLSDTIIIEMTLSKIGRSSFALEYSFSNADGQSVAKAKTVHVVTDIKTGKSTAIPSSLREALLTLGNAS